MTPQRQPAPPQDLAGRHLEKFFTDHLAGERAASPTTIGSYRDAMKLLIWFKDAEHIPPEKLRLVDIDRSRILRFLDWLKDRARLLGGHPQPPPRGDQVVLPLHRRRTARPPRPGHPGPRDPAENTPAPDLGHLTGDEVKTLLAEPGVAGARAVRDTDLLALAHDTAARVQELCDLNIADIRRTNTIIVTIHGRAPRSGTCP